MMGLKKSRARISCYLHACTKERPCEYPTKKRALTKNLTVRGTLILDSLQNCEK